VFGEVRDHDPRFGARPLRRAIQRMVENRLSEMVLGGKLEPGQRVRIDARDGRLEFDVLEVEGAAAGDREEEPVGVSSA
jgi:ATP-dependent Clp protease ATP-binding subunit ClpC